MIVPMRQAGYFEQDPSTFVSCLPASACPEDDVSALTADPASLSLTPYLVALREVLAVRAVL